MNKFSLLALISVMIFSCYGFAQTQNNMRLEVKLYSVAFDRSKANILLFMQGNNNIKISSQNEYSGSFDLEFKTNQAVFEDFQKNLNSFGTLESKSLSVVQEVRDSKTILLEIDHLQNKKETFEKEIARIGSSSETKYYELWDQARQMEEEISRLKKEMVSMDSSLFYIINLTLYDEIQDYSSRKVSWVNMPGFSYDVLWIETPQTGTSGAMYQGGSLKYLVTRGKSYAYLGAIKCFDKNVDTMQFKELFNLGFGQDLYSKHFGKGKNKFFNLYTGYTIGATFATGEKRSRTFGHLVPYLGVEIFKNKFINLDNKVGYWIPFKYNRNMRGVHYSISFNFVF